MLYNKTFGPGTVVCSVDGATTVSGDVASIFGFAVDDLIVVESSDCDYGFGKIVNDRMEFTVTAFSGDTLLTQFLLQVGAVLIDFEVTSTVDTVFSNGDALVSVDTTGNPLVALAI